MLPTLRQLHYLKLLAEHGSFSRAALAAHVTQPTLSAGVQELERILGAPMVDRNRSGVILTAAGSEAVKRAGAILAQAEDLVQASRGAGQPLSGRFRLGLIPTVAPFLLPPTLPVLRRRFPRLKLFLREDLTHRLIADLKGGILDAAVVALPYDMSGLDWIHVAEDELLVALPTGHPLAAVETIAPEGMEQEDLILLEDGHCLRDQVLAACGLGGRRQSANADFAATSLATLVQIWWAPDWAFPSCRRWRCESGTGGRGRPRHTSLGERSGPPRDRRRLARGFHAGGGRQAAGRGLRGGVTNRRGDLATPDGPGPDGARPGSVSV